MASIKIDDRQVKNVAALPHIGTAANATLDVILADIDANLLINVGAIDSVSPSVNGAVISGNAIYFQSASAINPGMVSTSTQSFAGAKTFTNTVTFAANVTSGQIIPVTNTSRAFLLFSNLSSGSALIGIEGAPGGELVTGDSPYDFVVRPGISSNLVFGYNGGSGIAQKIDTSGNVLIPKTLTLGASITPLTILGDPTNATQIQIGNSSTFSAIGAETSTGALFSAFNAQYVSQADNWHQNASGIASSLLDLMSTGLNLYSAAASTANGNKATFWGSPVFTVTNTGNVTLANALNIKGSSSGTVSILTQASAGTFSFNLPTTAGISGQFLTSGGGGATPMTWSSALSNPMTTAGDIIYENATPAPARLPIGSNGQILTAVSGTPAWENPVSSSYEIENLSISIQDSVNDLVINVKQSDAVTTPNSTGTGACKISFLGDLGTIYGSGGGSYNERLITSTLSIDVPSSAKLGINNTGGTSFIWLYAIDNAGTVELAISLTRFDEGFAQSTVALSGSSNNSSVLYSTTARTNVPIRLLARLRVTNSQVAGGSWFEAISEILYLPSSSEKSTLYLKYTGTTGQTITNNTNITFSGREFDSNGAWNGTTFTAPSNGLYRITAYMDFASSSQAVGSVVSMQLAGSSTQRMALFVYQTTSTIDISLQGSTLLQVLAGNTVTLQITTSASLTLGIGANSYIEVERVSDL